MWLPLALLSAVFAALVAVFGKIGLDKIDSTLATTVRAGIMFVALVAIAAATGKFSGLPDIKDKALLFIALSGLAGALSWLFYFWALKIGKASQVAPIDRFSAVFVVALAAVFLGEKVGLKTGIGTVLMTIGAILVALG